MNKDLQSLLLTKEQAREMCESILRIISYLESQTRYDEEWLIDARNKVEEIKRQIDRGEDEYGRRNS